MGRLTGLLGLITMLGLAYLFSSNRRAIRVKTVAPRPLSAVPVRHLRAGVSNLAAPCWSGPATAWKSSWSIPLRLPVGVWRIGEEEWIAGNDLCLPGAATVIFICAFFAVLYHFGVMQFIIRQMAKVMIRMGASGAESLDVAASIFMGQTEAPVTIRPLLALIDPLRVDDRE